MDNSVIVQACVLIQYMVTALVDLRLTMVVEQAKIKPVYTAEHSTYSVIGVIRYLRAGSETAMA